MLFLRPFGGEKSEKNDRKCLKLFFENVLPTEARSTFLKTSDAKSELEHKNYEGGGLKLALLMQIRIMIRPKYFFFTSLGNR